MPAVDATIVQARRFALAPPAEGPPGDHRAEILLRDAGRIVFRSTLNWQVVAALIASPKMIMIKPGTTSQRIMVRARDDQPFSITRVECSTPGVECHVENPSAVSKIHVVEVKIGSLPRGTRGSVTIVTDHAAQRQIVVSLLVLE